MTLRDDLSMRHEGRGLRPEDVIAFEAEGAERGDHDESFYDEVIWEGDPILVVDATEGKGADVDLVVLEAHPRAHVARAIGPDATRAVLPRRRPGLITILAIVDRADGGEDLHGYTMPAPDEG